MPSYIDLKGQVIPDGTPKATSVFFDRVTYGRPPALEHFTFEDIYQRVPAVYIVSRFLAKNVAQLPLNVFLKQGELERKRVNDHPLVRLLDGPNPGLTRFSWIVTIVEDLHIWGNTFWHIWKDAAGVPVAVVRLDPRKVKVEGRFWPERYTVDLGKDPMVVDAADVLHIKHYNPKSNLEGLSPMKALMGILLEDKSATEHRQAFWENGARPSFFLTRPSEATPWSAQARDAFKQEFYKDYSGEKNSGKIPILEEGMSVVEVSLSAREQQFLEARMQVTQLVCAALGVTPAMLGLPDSGTSFASIREMHTMLYQDSLGPLMEQIVQEIQRQLLPLFPNAAGLYVEFNFRAKLHGSPTEQAQATQTQVGGPVVTRNEARAAMDLPPVDGGDELITPLNVVTGGLASPTDTAPKA